MNALQRGLALRPGALRELLSAAASGPPERFAALQQTAPARAVAETLAALANANGGWLLLAASSAPLDAAPLDTTEQRDLLLQADLQQQADLLLQAALLCDPPLILPAPHALHAADLAAADLAAADLAALPQLSLQAAGMAAPALLLQVPPGLPNVYNVGGIYLTRSGAHNRPLSTPALRSLLLARGEGAYDAHLVDGATAADLDPLRVERYLERLLLLPADDPSALLLARGCLAPAPRPESGAFSDGADAPLRPTVAGLLLFGREPQRFLRSAEILCVRYPGTQMADAFVRQELSGPLTDQIHQAEAFVWTNLSLSSRLDGLARSEQPALPPAVVREAIVNAVAHRDYSVRGEGIRLLLFSNRLEIYSPGRLPGHVTLQNLLDERYSRNEALVALLSDLGYIERLGYGIDRMFAALRAAGLPEPRFEETAAGFRVTLFSAAAEGAVAAGAGAAGAGAAATPQPAAQPRRAAAARRAAQSAPHTAPNAAPHAAPHAAPLNERQQRAMAFVAEYGRMTNSDLQEMARDVSPETIRRDLADLVERTLLLRIGSKRATYYILK